VVRFLRGLQLIIQDKLGVHMLFMLTEANTIALKAEILMKERESRNNSSIFVPYRMSYIKVSKFSTTNKGKTIQTSR